MKARAGIMLCAMLAGCSVGPDYHLPFFKTPARYSDYPASAPKPDKAELSQWWLQFRDPMLNWLIQYGLNSNLDLQTAASRIREARENEIIAGAGAWPTLNATGSTVQAHFNRNPLGAITGNPQSSGGLDLHMYSAGLDASWEPDLFGGVRRGVEAAKAQTQETVWQMRGSEVSLIAEIANDYFALRAAQARRALLQSEIARQDNLVSLTQARQKAGFATGLDVNAASTQASGTAAQLPSIDADIRAQEHAIAVLVGTEPELLEATLSRAQAMPALPPGLPSVLPSDLLRRRPDIRAAERQLAAANAQIGVAVADLYPKFNLIGLASFSGNTLSNLLSSGNFAALGLGTITWPIFNAGRTEANIATKREQRQQAYLAYKKAILIALQNVEDALANYSASRDGAAQLEQSVRLARSTADLAGQRYRAGLTNYLNVLNAQSALLSARDRLVQARRGEVRAFIALYKALGGGWTPGNIAAAHK